MDIISSIYLGSTIYIADPDALKGTIVQTLKEARPTLFFSVPRVWEKMEAALKRIGAKNSTWKQKLGNWAKSVGIRGTINELRKKESFDL